MKLYFINSYKHYFLYANHDGTVLYEAQGYKDDFSPVSDLFNLELDDECNEVDITRLQFYSWLNTEEENRKWLQSKLSHYKLEEQ